MEILEPSLKDPGQVNPWTNERIPPRHHPYHEFRPLNFRYAKILDAFTIFLQVLSPHLENLDPLPTVSSCLDVVVISISWPSHRCV